MNSLLQPSAEVNEKRSGQQTGALSVCLEAQGRLFKAKVPGRGRCGGGLRGKVRGLSRAARKRMLEAMARVNWAVALLAGGLTFVTLTYHERWPDDPVAQWEQVKRWSRMMGFPWALWRREFQRRGAPHWHLLVAGPYHAADCLRKWRAVTGDYSITQVEASPITSVRAALRYVSKYMGKVDQQAPREARSADAAPGSPGPCLTDVAYSDEADSSGRLWGFIGRAEVPWAEAHTVTLPLGEWVWRLRRSAGRRYRKLARRGRRGFMLFTDGAADWLGLAAWYYGQEQAS